MSVLTKNKGNCNGIGQVYKILLEKINTYGFCICCYFNEELHQLIMVYYNKNDTFSFDNPNMVIINNNINEYFDLA